MHAQHQHVLVQLGSGLVVPGLVLKHRAVDEQALVTYELDGKVATDWIAADRLRPLSEEPPNAEPVEV